MTTSRTTAICVPRFHHASNVSAEESLHRGGTVGGVQAGLAGRKTCAKLGTGKGILCPMPYRLCMAVLLQLVRAVLCRAHLRVDRRTQR